VTVFDEYARYYNLLYKDKDYQAEADFTLACLRRAGCTPSTLLDLGCGTGRHALAMTRRGIRVTGLDASEAMLAMGKEVIECDSKQCLSYPLPELIHGDARSLRLDRTFDAVTSLFHVMSYQNTEKDALDMLATARAHLAPGGFFLFDFWHGPGVLTEPPARRERELEDEQTRIIRIAEPEHRVNDNIVVVHYHVSITDKVTGRQSELREDHSMRYWFLPELRYLAKLAGLYIHQEGVWMHEGAPGLCDWHAWMLAQ
jgi:SAM-dependent methyltransferase